RYQGKDFTMPLSVVDLYRDVLPKTNCRDCGFATCLAFAGMVVSEKLPLDGCPHIDPETAARCQKILDAQHAAGKWTRRDMAEDALVWAREKAASMAIEDLPHRIGGRLVGKESNVELELPYFSGLIRIGRNGVRKADDEPLNRWEQVFIYNHMAQGGKVNPTGRWKAFQEIPNTVSKIKSMRAHVEIPLAERFSGKPEALAEAARRIGGLDKIREHPSADAAWRFTPLPKVPVMLLFWNQDDEFEAKIKLLFDETVCEHLDIESILFLSERLVQLLCDNQAG
ncbi:DUF3786 domain-containing protein, partial [Desulfococcus sp.]